MPFLKTLLLTSSLVLLLAGCGQKGPLYREAPAQSAQADSDAPLDTGESADDEPRESVSSD